MKLPALDAAETTALAGLLGLPRAPAAGERLSLDRLDAALRDSAVEAGLREVLEALGGPLLDRPALRAAEAASRQELWVRAASLRGLEGRPELAVWLAELRELGLVARAAQSSGVAESRLLELSIAAAVRLPAPAVLLSVLAVEVTGDAHALDPGRPLAALVQRAAAKVAGWPALPESAAERRRLWAEVGVLCDPLSAQVLALGLRPSGPDLLSRHLRASAEAGEPRRMTLRELARWEPTLPEGTTLFVCENPSVVAAAADQLGAACAPLVCVEGVPSTAALVLLRALSRAGAAVRFHSDFDWAGIRIGNLLALELGAAPWRFAGEDYAATIAGLPGAEPLRGSAVDARWDPQLAARMREAGRAVFEEQVMETLLGDLREAPDT